MSRFVVMGVSGCGKSHIGALFAKTAGLSFIDGDDLHPQANIDKMARGEPLTDLDRAPWLDLIGQALQTNETVIACSALKRTYRRQINDAAGHGVTFLFLRGQEATLHARMTTREGHFMPPGLLQSQLATLEPPMPEERHVTADIEMTPSDIVAVFQTGLKELSA